MARKHSFIPRQAPGTGAISQASEFHEEERNRTEARRASEEQFRSLVDNIPHLVWIAAPGTEGQATWFNKAWLDYTGTTLEQNQGSGWQAVHHPDYAENVIRKFEHHVREGLDWEDTFPLRGKDGQYRWFLSRMNVIRDESGKPLRIFGTNTDITEQKLAGEQVARQAQELRTFNECLQELDHAKTDFFSNVCREFRTPLTLMLGPLEDALANGHGILPYPLEFEKTEEVLHA